MPPLEFAPRSLWKRFCAYCTMTTSPAPARQQAIASCCYPLRSSCIRGICKGVLYFACLALFKCWQKKKKPPYVGGSSKSSICRSGMRGFSLFHILNSVSVLGWQTCPSHLLREYCDTPSRRANSTCVSMHN